MLGIKSKDLVLEIGSGNRPRKRSDILCDRYIESNTERAGGEALVIDNRPFIVADGQALPFKDKSFDYVITSHVLEHVDDPLKFISELTRVAKAGYIETPSELGEKIFGWSFHKWIVRLEKDTLIMRPRTSESPFLDYFHRMYERDLLFAEFIDSHFDDYYIRYEWKGTINIKVEDDYSNEVKFSKSSQDLQIDTAMKEIKIELTRKFLKIFLKILRHFRKFGK